jgi:hypothetical protein
VPSSEPEAAIISSGWKQTVLTESKCLNKPLLIVCIDLPWCIYLPFDGHSWFPYFRLCLLLSINFANLKCILGSLAIQIYFTPRWGGSFWFLKYIYSLPG